MEKYQPVQFLNMLIDCLATVMDKKKILRLYEFKE